MLRVVDARKQPHVFPVDRPPPEDVLEVVVRDPGVIVGLVHRRIRHRRIALAPHALTRQKLIVLQIAHRPPIPGMPGIVSIS